ncbi:DsrE family protein [Demequina oxidasica]|uniref:DsrE family protein n=1 Tax=Demequina oxidasica TaxID=676199 RepID=UPI000783421E|nr:DsrE family protein [Demequina oxidasica]
MSEFKVAVVIYEPIDGDMARAYRGLKTALEFKQAGDDVVVQFDGSGVDTLAAISNAEHPMNGLATALADNITGACGYCATSHKVADAIEQAGWTLLSDDGGEASNRKLMVEGYQILTF